LGDRPRGRERQEREGREQGKRKEKKGDMRR